MFGTLFFFLLPIAVQQVPSCPRLFPRPIRWKFTSLKRTLDRLCYTLARRGAFAACWKLRLSIPVCDWKYKNDTIFVQSLVIKKKKKRRGRSSRKVIGLGDHQSTSLHVYSTAPDHGRAVSIVAYFCLFVSLQFPYRLFILSERVLKDLFLSCISLFSPLIFSTFYFGKQTGADGGRRPAQPGRNGPGRGIIASLFQSIFDDFDDRDRPLFVFFCCFRTFGRHVESRTVCA